MDDDTPKLVNSCSNCLMYANYLILISRSESGLQALLNRLGNYCRKCRMEVNIEKTKVMKFSGNGHKCKTIFLYNDKPVESVSKYKYLGMNLVLQMIRPILCYGSELWSAFDGNKKVFQNTDDIATFLDSLDIEKVHIKFCKLLLGFNKRAVNQPVKGELGLFPIGISCMLQALKYWYHKQSLILV